MGMKLVGLAMAKWAPHINDQCFRVLMRMAMSALDEDSEKYRACLYFGGRDPLISVMNEADKRDPKALEQAIIRAIRKLIQLGAVKRANKPGPGRRAEYQLTLENPVGIDQPRTSRAVNGYHAVNTMGITGRLEWVSPGDSNGYHPVIPQGEQRITEEQEEEQGVDLRSPVTLAHATRNGDPRMEKKCDNEDCEFGYRYDASKPKGQRNIRCPDCRPANVIPIPEDRLSRRRSSNRRT